LLQPQNIILVSEKQITQYKMLVYDVIVTSGSLLQSSASTIHLSKKRISKQSKLRFDCCKCTITKNKIQILGESPKLSNLRSFCGPKIRSDKILFYFVEQNIQNSGI